MTPQVCWYPALRATQPVSPIGNATETGDVRMVVDPSPTCPNELLPQHQPWRDDETAHVWLEPAVMLSNVDSKGAEAARTMELRASRELGDDCASGVPVTVATDIVGEAEADIGAAVTCF